MTEKPCMSDPDWHDYVMSHFENDELYEGKPTTYGLRRIVGLLLGEIVYSVPKEVRTDSPERAVVVCEVRIKKHKLNDQSTEDVIVYGDVADVWYGVECGVPNVGNITPDFAIFATPTAATRAEGRALRKALQLKCVCAEEMAFLPKPESQDDDSINSPQIHVVNSICKSLDLNVMKVVNAGKKKYKDIKEVSKVDASKIIERLNTLQNDKSKIKEAIRGYQSEWRN